MASSITIDITANLVDNATEKARSLESVMEKLEKYRNLDLGTVKVNTSGAQSNVDSLINSFERNVNLDTSSVSNGIKTASNGLETFAQTKAETFVDADTSSFDRKMAIAESRKSAFNSETTVKDLSESDFTAENRQRWMDEMIIVPYNNETPGSAQNSMGTPSTENWKQYDSNDIISSIEGTPQVDLLSVDAADLTLEQRQNMWADVPFVDKTGSSETYTGTVGTPATGNWVQYDSNDIQSQIDTYVENTKAVKESTRAAKTIIGDDNTKSIGSQITAGFAGFGASLAKKYLGARAVYKGINAAVGDFADAIESDNSLDRTRSLSHGATRVGMMGIGALAGSVIPGVGTMLGAGAGNLLYNLFGDNIADAFTDIHKSFEELKNDYLSEYFGSAAVSAEQLSNATKQMLNLSGWNTVITQARTLNDAFDMNDTLDATTYSMKELGSKITILDNLERKVSKDDFNNYIQGAKSYAETAKETLTSNMLGDLMSADSLLGPDSSVAKTITDNYAEAFNNIDAIELDLGKYIKIAAKDGEITPEETAGILDYIQQIQDIVSNQTQSKAENDLDIMKMMMGDGTMSFDSFQSMLGNYGTQALEAQQGYAQQLQNVLRNITTTDEKEAAAEKKAAYAGYYSNVGNLYAGAVDSGVQFINGKFANDENYISGKQEIQQTFSDNLSGIRFDAAVRPEVWGNTVADNNVLSRAQNFLGYDDFIKNNEFLSSSIADAYNAMQPSLETLEGTAKGLIANGGDASSQLTSLMHGWEMGTMGGNEDATMSLLGAKYSQIPEMAEVLNNAISSGTADSLNQDMIEAFKLFSGNYKDTAEHTADEIKNGAETVNEAERNAADEMNNTATESAESRVQNEVENTQAVNDTVKDCAESTADTKAEAAGATPEPEQAPSDAMNKMGQAALEAVAESFNTDNLDFTQIGVGEKLMNAISESLLPENMDFGKLDFGSDFMSAIGESLLPENTDFGKLDFGSQFMNAISESLLPENMDFGSLEIGSQLMSTISQSLSADSIDFSGLGLGENIMSGISASFEGMDMGSLDIGSKIMSSINSSFESVDIGSIDIASKITEAVSAESIEITANMTITPGSVDTSGVESVIQESISSLEAQATANIAITATVNYEIGEIPVPEIPELTGIVNYEVGTTPTEVPNIIGTADYNLGSYPTEVPSVSGIANYEGVFPTSAPTLHGTVVYTAVGLPSTGFANGTQNAPGGPAVVNDDGSADPRELIEHNGQFRMYEGRDVMTYLSPHDKVYTSSQTKAILSKGALPHYAGGKNNSINASIFKGNAASKFENGTSISIGGVTVAISVDAQNNANAVESISSHYDEIAEAVVDRLANEMISRAANVPVRG